MNICFNCGEKSINKYPLCDKCHPKIIDKNYCTVCGIPTSKLVSICCNCIENNTSKAVNRSLFFYSGLSKEILSLYKFSKDYRFANYYIKYLLNIINTKENPIVCPVPTSIIKRRLKSGYQLDPLLRLLKKNGVEVKYLLKKRYSRTQKRLSKKERIENLSKSFKLRSLNVNRSREILLLDDVYTTGATLKNCYKILHSAGYLNISSLTLCRD